MKTILFSVFLSTSLFANTIIQLKDLITLETIIKTSKIVCLKEKDLNEVYRTYRIFYENKMEALKNRRVASLDEKNLIELSKNCKESCSCQVLLDFLDNKMLKKKTKSILLTNISVPATEINEKDYQMCFEKQFKNCAESKIVKEFNEFKAD